MRVLALLLAGMLGGPAFAQTFEGSVSSGFAGNITSGFSADIASGFQSGFVQTRRALGPPTDQFSPDGLDAGPDASLRLDLARRGIDIFGCAPGQVDINRTGCVSSRELRTRQQNTYDTSIGGFAPLTGLTLDQSMGQGVSAGPQGPLD